MGIRTIVVSIALLAGASTSALALQAAQIEGSWRSPNGTCEQAYLRTGEATDSPRGETALRATVNNDGTMVEGTLVLEGQRRGQIILAETDSAAFLVDMPGGKARVIPMGLEYRSWPELILEKCP